MLQNTYVGDDKWLNIIMPTWEVVFQWEQVRTHIQVSIFKYVRDVIRGCFVKRHFASRKLKGRKERMRIPIMAIKKRGSFARAFIRLFADIPAILGRGLFMIICINNDTHTILPHIYHRISRTPPFFKWVVGEWRDATKWCMRGSPCPPSSNQIDVPNWINHNPRTEHVFVLKLGGAGH